MAIELDYNGIILGAEGRVHLMNAAHFITERILNRGASLITLEGPPPYLDPIHPVHRWDNPAFQNGWRILTSLRQGFERVIPIQHWVMIDDVHVRAGFDLDSAVKALEATGIIPPAEQYIMEREFNKSEGDECTTMDSRFQVLKLLEGLSGIWHEVIARNADISALNLPLNVVIHPVSFRGQQSGMLSELLARMKNDGYLSQIPKKKRAELLEQTYMHIWLDDYTGEITDISRPRMNGGGFKHQSIFT